MWIKFFLASAILMLATSFACCQSDEKPAKKDAAKTQTSLKEVESPKAAPKLVLSQWQNSAPLSLASMRGKVVVLDFWATWCGPCIRSIPKNNELHQKFKNQDVVLLGICSPDGSEDMKEKAKKHSINYPIAVSTDKKTIHAYKVKAYPTYNIIGRNGKLRFVKCPKSKIEDAVSLLLKEKPPVTTSGGGRGFTDNPFFKK